MGILRTPSHDLPYPDGAENVDLVTELGELAKAVDTALDGVAGATPGPVALDDLTDVDVAGAPAVDGQGLLFDAGSGLWKPGDFPAGGGATVLNELGDVDTVTTAPATGDGLMFNGTTWVPGAVSGGGTGVTTLDGLTDVDTTTVAPGDGEVLTFDTATGLWVPAVAPSATPGPIDALTDVDTTTVVPAPGEALVWNGSTWVPGAVSGSGSGGAATLDALDDVDTTTVAPAAGNVLRYSAGQWRPATDVAKIDDLTDVDTATTAPTNGQTLVWNGTNWVPGTAGGGGSSAYDTGWRVVTRNAAWASGTVLLRRIGKTVHLWFHSAQAGTSGNLTLYALPTGFQAPTSLDFQYMHVGRMANADDTTQRTVAIYADTIKAMNYPTSTSMSGRAEWVTDDAEPATLPGTAF